MISEELILDASQADQTIAQIDQQLQQAAELFKVALADALDILSQPIIAQVSADTAPAETEIAALADTAPTVVPVTTDTTEAEQLILDLGNQPPIDIPVTTDTTEAEQLILNLGDQPPIDIPVTADTEQAKAAIDALAATAPPVDLLVEADTEGAQQSIADLGSSASSASDGVGTLEGSVTGLGAAAGIAEGSAKELVSAIGEMGGGESKTAAAGVLTLTAAVGGFFEEGLNAVSAGQRFNMILGTMAEEARHIDVNGLSTSIDELGIKFGSTSAEMENATAKLVQFSLNSGNSKEKSILFAHEIETLAARAIALNPTLGTLADATDALGTKIGRGGRFAQQYGIDLSTAAIADRAKTDTGKEVTSQLTFMEKAIAGAELASEKYGGTLAGTVAEGEKNAAIQAESLKATFKEAIEQIGVPLVAPVLDLLREAEPDAVLIAQDLATIGKDALPAVAAALAVIDPPLRLLSAVLDAIPSPIIAATVGFFGFSAALTAVAEAVGITGTALAIVDPYLTAIAAASAIAVGAMSLFGGSNEDTQKHVADLTTALSDQDGVLRITTDDLTKYLEKSSDIGKDPALVDALNKAGLSFQDLAGFVEQGSAGLQSLAQHLVGSGGLREAIQLNGAEVRDSTGEIHQNSETVEIAGQRYVVLDDKARKLISTFSDLQTTSQKTAEQQLASAVASKTLTDQQVQQAEAQHRSSDGTIDYIGALNDLTPIIAQSAAATSSAADADKAAAQQKKDLQTALEALAASAPDVVSALQSVETTVGDGGLALENLAISAGHANLSTKELDLVASQLGVTSTQLQGFIKNVTGELDSFVNTAVSKLPDVSTAIDNALDPKNRKDKPIIIDPAQLEKELQGSIDAINNFNANIETLVGEGFNNLAQVAAERGPEFTQGLVSAIDKGGSDMGATLDAKFGELNDLTRAEPDKLREAGSGIIVATGDVADLASASFGAKFQLVPPTQAQIDEARHAAELGNIPFSEALAAVAGQGSAAFEQGLSPIPSATSATIGAADQEIDGWAHNLAASGQGTGEAGSTGFAQGLAPVLPTAETLFNNVTSAITVAKIPLGVAAHLAGEQIGKAFDDGISTGIDAYVAGIEQSARNAITAAQTAAKQRAGISSPSRLFMEVGKNIAQGLALGIISDTHLAEKAGRDMIAKAVGIVPSRSINAPSMALPTLGDVAGIATAQMAAAYRPASVSGPSAGPTSLFRDLIVQVEGAGMTPSDARQVGGTIGAVVIDRLSDVAGRRLVVGTGTV